NDAMPKPAGGADAPRQGGTGGTRQGNNEGRSPGSSTTPSDTVAGAGGAGTGQTVGMLLVSSLDGTAAGRPVPGSSSGSAGETGDSGRSKSDRPQDSSTGRTARDTAGASTGMARGGPLAPGAYAIKREGNSVWLTDASGQVALRTSIDMPNPTSTSSSSTSPDDAGSSSRGTTTTGTAMGGAHDWELVFGAITKEAMTSMGWAHQRSGMRR
ncbi:MAG: hypothetical protein ABIP94_23920, partial [Planctomycetota bacterium]